MLFRDFLNSSKILKTKVSQPNAKAVFTVSLQNLQYFLPFYLDAVSLNQFRYTGDYLDEEEDFEMEFQSLVVQVLSLMSTVMSIYPKLIFKDLKGLTQPLLMTMFLYSLKSPYES